MLLNREYCSSSFSLVTKNNFFAILRMKPLVMKRMFRPWLNIQFLNQISKLHKEIKKEYDVLVNYKDEVIKKNAQEDLSSLDEIFAKQILDEKNKFTEQEVIDEVVIFMIAVSI